MTQPRPLIAERYRLLESLGAGGMGRVWLARDEMLRRDVAIKEVIPPDGLTRPEREELRLRTLREARAAARLNDAAVVRIYDVIYTDGTPWIVMEYVPSRSLHQVITDDGPLPPARVAQIGLAVLQALKAAHAAGVLHRDVKPGNVLLADTGRVVLTDFGLAVFEGGDGAVTRPGLILGSPQYISPERARDGISGPEADLWSLGATLYAAVEGRSPYARSTTYATLTALATEEPDPPTRAGPLKPVLTALLRKDPRSRAGVAETERLLQRAAAGETRSRPWPLPALPRQRRSREHHSVGSLAGLPAAAAVAPVSAQPAAASDYSPEPIRAGREGDPGPLVVMTSEDDDTYRTVPPDRRGLWLVVAAVGLIIAVAAALLFTDRDAPGPDALSQPLSVPAGPSTAASPARSPSPAVQASIGDLAVQLPPGFHFEWEKPDGSGWRIGVPDGWIRTPHPTSPSMVYFVSNTDQRMRLGVDVTDTPPATSPKQDWQNQEADRLRRKVYPNYQRIRIEDSGYRGGGCAEWQWYYDSSQGGRQRVSNVGCRIRADLGQAIYWECAADDWDKPAVQQIHNIVMVSFQPRPA